MRDVFYLTSYYGFLPEPLLIDKNYYFDNPGSLLEINYISGILEKSMMNDSSNTTNVDIHSLRGKVLKINNEELPNRIEEFFNSQKFDYVAGPYDTFISNCICLFCDYQISDESELEFLKFQKSKKRDKFKYFDSESYIKRSMEIDKNRNDFRQFKSLLDLVVSIIENKSGVTAILEESNHFSNHLHPFASNRNSDNLKQLVNRLYSTRKIVKEEKTKVNAKLYDLSEIFPEIMGILNKIYSLKGTQIMNYAAEIMSIVNESDEEKSKVVHLTSIIELFATHQPNPKNPDDSITKQFVRNSLLIQNHNNPNGTSAKLESELKILYKLRSAIAHGNFSRIPNLIKSLSVIYSSFLDSDGKSTKIISDEKTIVKILLAKLRYYVYTTLEVFIWDNKTLNQIKRGSK